jgi:hypothetical protein
MDGLSRNERRQSEASCLKSVGILAVPSVRLKSNKFEPKKGGLHSPSLSLRGCVDEQSQVGFGRLEQVYRPSTHNAKSFSKIEQSRFARIATQRFVERRFRPPRPPQRFVFLRANPFISHRLAFATRIGSEWRHVCNVPGELLSRRLASPEDCLCSTRSKDGHVTNVPPHYRAR